MGFVVAYFEGGQVRVDGGHCCNVKDFQIMIASGIYAILCIIRFSTNVEDSTLY
jgi:hypothetical protein